MAVLAGRAGQADLDPILPGQTSTFKTMSRANPAMKKFSVEFTHLLGRSIATEDQSVSGGRSGRH
jgi:hypothetical protein